MLLTPNDDAMACKSLTADDVDASSSKFCDVGALTVKSTSTHAAYLFVLFTRVVLLFDLVSFVGWRMNQQKRSQTEKKNVFPFEIKKREKKMFS